MPLPTKLPSAPSCIISAASAGVAMPPAEKLTTGSLPPAAPPPTRSAGAPQPLAPPRRSARGHPRPPPRLPGDLGLVGGDAVHDAAALEHLGQAALDARASRRVSVLGCARAVLGHD